MTSKTMALERKNKYVRTVFLAKYKSFLGFREVSLVLIFEFDIRSISEKGSHHQNQAPALKLVDGNPSEVWVTAPRARVTCVFPAGGAGQGLRR